MSIVKEIGQTLGHLIHPFGNSAKKPQLTEEIAQQMRAEAEYGSMYLPDELIQSLERSRDQRPPINDPRSTKLNG